jgi:hypothetical protein
LPTMVFLLRMAPGGFRANWPITRNVCLWVLPSRRVARTVKASLFLGFVTGLPLSMRHARSMLFTSPTDWKLLCFEPMRILDTAHHWAVGTHLKYQGKLSAMMAFEDSFAIPQNHWILQPTPLMQPPSPRKVP